MAVVESGQQLREDRFFSTRGDTGAAWRVRSTEVEESEDGGPPTEDATHFAAAALTYLGLDPEQSLKLCVFLQAAGG